MASSNNKFLAILAISNLLGFTVIFILLWMLWNHTSTVQQKDTVNPYPPVSSPPRLAAKKATRESTWGATIQQTKNPRQLVKANDLSIISAVAKEVRSNNIDSNRRLNMNMPEKINSETHKPEAIKSETSNKTYSSSATFSDDDYIATYNQLKTNPVTQRQYTKKDVTTVSIADKTHNKAEPAADHFNKVDVSHIKNKQTGRQSLAQQVAAIAITSPETAIDKRNYNNVNSYHKANDTSEEFTGWQAYLHSLKDAEAERQNEMRTITVKRGETLWKIATRAYGTGHQYKKIFNANPHLTSPDSITVGETLRVPL